MNKPTKLRNTTWHELQVGASASLTRACMADDLLLFAHVSGNMNPTTLPADAPASDVNANANAIAPSMWVGSLISAVLGNLLPGPGTLYRAQSLNFIKRVHVGEQLTVTVTCKSKEAEPVAVFETQVVDAKGDMVCSGTAEVDVPRETVEIEARDLPSFFIDRTDHFARIVELAAELPPLRTAVVCPDDANSLGGAMLAAERKIIELVLIGDEGRIRAAAKALGLDLGTCQIVQEADHHAAAARAVAMARSGEVGAIMKGNIHSDELLSEVINKDRGLRTNRRISHVFAMDVATLDHILFISDAAINIAPDLVTKVDIVQNAIDLAMACGVVKPKVGILSAVETVNPNIPSTLDAAILSKMAERGQIRGGVVDGPLAMDNAIDLEAARTKGIGSSVAGQADVLIVPNLEAGNMLAKELTFVAHAEAAGIVIGARVPVMLTSRADNDRSRLASSAIAVLFDYWRREGRPYEGRTATALAAE